VSVEAVVIIVLSLLLAASLFVGWLREKDFVNYKAGQGKELDRTYREIADLRRANNAWLAATKPVPLTKQGFIDARRHILEHFAVRVLNIPGWENSLEFLRIPENADATTKADHDGLKEARRLYIKPHLIKRDRDLLVLKQRWDIEQFDSKTEGAK